MFLQMLIFDVSAVFGKKVEFHFSFSTTLQLSCFLVVSSLFLLCTHGPSASRCGIASFSPPTRLGIATMLPEGLRGCPLDHRVDLRELCTSLF